VAQREEDRLAGTISGLVEGKYYGFIVVPGHRKDYFFHGSSLRGVTFEELAPGDRVTFVVVDTEKGIRAVGVERI